MYSRILVAVDESPNAEHAVKHAAGLDKGLSATLRIVHVVDIGWLPLGPELAIDIDAIAKARRAPGCRAAVARKRRRRRDTAFGRAGSAHSTARGGPVARRASVRARLRSVRIRSRDNAGGTGSARANPLRLKASGAAVGFTTNGTRLGEDNLARLLDVPINIMDVSIAGTTAAASDRWRAGNDFACLGEALRALKNMKNTRAQTGPQVHIAYMLLASGWRELEGLPALAEAWGASAAVVNNLSIIADAALNEEALFERPELWWPALMAPERARQSAAALEIELYYHRPDRQEPHAQCTEHVLDACFVSWQGDVAPCVPTNHSIKAGSAPTYYFRGRSYPVESCVFGNVNETTFDAIWNSDEARAFRAAFERRSKRKHLGTDDLPAPCRHCYKLYEP